MKTVCPKIYLQIWPYGWISKNPIHFVVCDRHIKVYLKKLWYTTRPNLQINLYKDMSLLYFLLSLKVAITIKVLQDQEYAPRSWLKSLPLLHESHFDEKQKSFFFLLILKRLQNLKRYFQFCSMFNQKLSKCKQIVWLCNSF